MPGHIYVGHPWIILQTDQVSVFNVPHAYPCGNVMRFVNHFHLFAPFQSLVEVIGYQSLLVVLREAIQLILRARQQTPFDGRLPQIGNQGSSKAHIKPDHVGSIGINSLGNAVIPPVEDGSANASFIHSGVYEVFT